MEINLNSNGFGNVGLGLRGVDFATTSKTPDVQASKPLSVRTETLDALKSSEPVANVPDAALSRDDALGKLVSSAFNLPPPPMPSFT